VTDDIYLCDLSISIWHSLSQITDLRYISLGTARPSSPRLGAGFRLSLASLTVASSNGGLYMTAAVAPSPNNLKVTTSHPSAGCRFIFSSLQPLSLKDFAM